MAIIVALSGVISATYSFSTIESAMRHNKISYAVIKNATYYEGMFVRKDDTTPYLHHNDLPMEDLIQIQIALEDLNRQLYREKQFIFFVDPTLNLIENTTLTNKRFKKVLNRIGFRDIRDIYNRYDYVIKYSPNERDDTSFWDKHPNLITESNLHALDATLKSFITEKGLSNH